MIIYYIIFFILSLLAYQEIYSPKPLNIYSYIFLTIGFSIFIGLRNEIGCDWLGYKRVFDLTNCIPNLGNDQCSWPAINSTIDYLKFKEVGFSLLNLVVKKLGGNFYIANYVAALFFILPLLSFCSTLKRPFLAILISYPYLITVIGLGTIRQSIAISLLMIAIIELNKLRFYKFYLYNFIGALFHYSSLIFIFLPFFINNQKSKQLKRIKKILIVFIFVLSFLFLIYNDNYFIQQLNGYLYYASPISIKSPLIIWAMFSIPSAILLLNYKHFKSDDKNKFWRNFSLIGISMFATIFFINNIIALRFLLYFLPIKIYVLSNLTKIKIFHKSPKIIYLVIMFISLSFLTIWLNFANHSYCYLPYKNLLLK